MEDILTRRNNFGFAFLFRNFNRLFNLNSMKSSSLLLIAVAFVFVACGGKKATSDNKGDTKNNPLVQTDIFNKDAVNSALNRVDSSLTWTLFGGASGLAL